jgi:anhydro-N-acetylmuramic acid kinase
MAGGRYLGLMSGTSMNGVDGAVVQFEHGRFVAILGTGNAHYSPDLRQRLLRLVREQPALTLAEYAALDHEVGEAFATAAARALTASGRGAQDIDAIGSHGQTVFHHPHDARPSSLQLGDPNLIAARTGIDVVADFRRKDIALKGQGAPLVPAFHHAVFAVPDEVRCVVNIGGIANVTLLDGDDPARIRGFDTGPGNGLMDEWVEHHRGSAYDDAGRFGGEAEGHAPELLEALLGDPYFARSPPKSTGRTYFNLEWVRARYPDLSRVTPAVVQRSFCELTGRSIADAIRAHAPRAARILVCGGGAFNPLLMNCIRGAAQGIPVTSSADFGLDPALVEAAAFAWLAMRTIQGLPGNVPAVTGATRPVVLGGIFRA